MMESSTSSSNTSLETNNLDKPDNNKPEGVLNLAYEANEDDSKETDMKRNSLVQNGGGKILNHSKKEMELPIPDDAVLNYDTGRVRSKRKANSANGGGGGTDEKIPMNVVFGDNLKAQEALGVIQNGHHAESGTVVTVPVASPLTSDKILKDQSNGGIKMFDEYFIPVNTHKKFLRGEKLYLTKEKRLACTGWKRVLLCCLLTLFLGIAVLVGILAAMGLLLNDTKPSQRLASLDSGSSSLPSSSSISQTFPKSHKNSASSEASTVSTSIVTTASTTVHYTTSGANLETTQHLVRNIPVTSEVPFSSNVSYGVWGKLTFPEEVFTENLNDKSSPEYETLQSQLTDALRMVLQNKGYSVDHIGILYFKPGSVEATFVILGKEPKLSAYEVQTALINYLKLTHGKLAGRAIDPYFLRVRDVIDECQMANGGCSDICSFDYKSLSKSCSCYPLNKKIDEFLCLPEMTDSAVVHSETSEASTELITESTEKSEITISEEFITDTPATTQSSENLLTTPSMEETTTASATSDTPPDPLMTKSTENSDFVGLSSASTTEVPSTSTVTDKQDSFLTSSVAPDLVAIDITKNGSEEENVTHSDVPVSTTDADDITETVISVTETSFTNTEVVHSERTTNNDISTSQSTLYDRSPRTQELNTTSAEDEENTTQQISEIPSHLTTLGSFLEQGQNGPENETVSIPDSLVTVSIETNDTFGISPEENFKSFTYSTVMNSQEVLSSTLVSESVENNVTEMVTEASTPSDNGTSTISIYDFDIDIPVTENSLPDDKEQVTNISLNSQSEDDNQTITFTPSTNIESEPRESITEDDNIHNTTTETIFELNQESNTTEISDSKNSTPEYTLTTMNSNIEDNGATDMASVTNVSLAEDYFPDANDSLTTTESIFAQNTTFVSDMVVNETDGRFRTLLVTEDVMETTAFEFDNSTNLNLLENTTTDSSESNYTVSLDSAGKDLNVTNRTFAMGRNLTFMDNVTTTFDNDTVGMINDSLDMSSWNGTTIVTDDGNFTSDDMLNEFSIGEKNVTENSTLYWESTMDGVNSTVNETTEAHVQCEEGQFLCDGMCQDQSLVCDGFKDCIDETDELNCTTCGENFQCKNSSFCVMASVRCDGVWDCEDGSDEEDCLIMTCSSGEVKCKDNSSCVKPLHICDGTYNCLDKSDEIKCFERNTCEMMKKFYCSDGLCIPSALKCDGHYDCINGDDEVNCSCPEDHFRCMDLGCIPLVNQCDGNLDCFDGSDEIGCLQIDSEGIVQVFSGDYNSWTLMCADNITKENADSICQELSFSGAERFYSKLVITNTSDWTNFHDLNDTGDIWTSGVNRTDSCETGALVVYCKQFECAKNRDALFRSRREVNTPKATTDVWPHLALLTGFNSERACHAEIISPLWLLTSANCLRQLPQNESLMNVQASFAADGNFTVQRSISKYFIHPHSSVVRSKTLPDYDLALVKVNKPFQFSKSLASVCLPDLVPQSKITCVVASFGDNIPRGNFPKTVQLTSFTQTLLERNECNDRMHYGNSVSPMMICSDTSKEEKTRDPCDNDLGAPLLCFQGTTSSWSLAGILTYQRFCGTYNEQPTVFANVYAMKGFIDKVTGQKNYNVSYDPTLYTFYEEPTTISSDLYNRTVMDFDNSTRGPDTGRVLNISQDNATELGSPMISALSNETSGTVHLLEEFNLDSSNFTSEQSLQNDMAVDIENQKSVNTTLMPIFISSANISSNDTKFNDSILTNEESFLLNNSSAQIIAEYGRDGNNFSSIFEESDLATVTTPSATTFVMQDTTFTSATSTENPHQNYSTETIAKGEARSAESDTLLADLVNETQLQENIKTFDTMLDSLNISSETSTTTKEAAYQQTTFTSSDILATHAASSDVSESSEISVTTAGGNTDQEFSDTTVATNVFIASDQNVTVATPELAFAETTTTSTETLLQEATVSTTTAVSNSSESTTTDALLS